jgi:hypothetical protein
MSKSVKNRLSEEAEHCFNEAVRADVEGLKGAAALFLAQATFLEKIAPLYSPEQSKSRWHDILLGYVPAWPSRISDAVPGWVDAA